MTTRPALRRINQRRERLIRITAEADDQRTHKLARVPASAAFQQARLESEAQLAHEANALAVIDDRTAHA